MDVFGGGLNIPSGRRCWRRACRYVQPVPLSSRLSLERLAQAACRQRICCPHQRDGLIATTGRPSGEIGNCCEWGLRQARLSAAEFRDIFGLHNFFLEPMDDGPDIENRVPDGLIPPGRDLGGCRCWPHQSNLYMDQARGNADRERKVLLCVQSGKERWLIGIG